VQVADGSRQGVEDAQRGSLAGGDYLGKGAENDRENLIHVRRMLLHDILSIGGIGGTEGIGLSASMLGIGGSGGIAGLGGITRG
jgi:hypothetical protein